MGTLPIAVNVIKIKNSMAVSGGPKTVPNILTADVYLSNTLSLTSSRGA